MEIDQLNSGKLITNPKLSAECFNLEYKWMSDHLRDKVPSKLIYPLWAWETKPLIEDILEGYSGEELFIVTFKINQDLILGSDFSDWHAILNNSYASWSEQDDNNFDELCKTISKEERQKIIINSWDRIFDYKNPKRDIEWSSELDIQYVFWELNKSQVKEIKQVKFKEK